MPYLEVALVLLLIVLNGILALSEMAIASSRTAKLRSMADEGVKGARRALALAGDPGKFLSTVQIGITLIGILAGAFSGATLGDRLARALIARNVPVDIAEALGFGLVIGIITYLSLIIGELVPKQIALRNPERLACLVSPAMTTLAKLAAPLVWLLNQSGRLLLTILGQGRAKEETVTDAEIHALIGEAESAGVLEPEERTMIAGVMRLSDRLVRTIMTPRSDVSMIDVSDPPSKIGKLMASSGHSRLVAFEGKPENILGVLLAKDVAAACLQKRPLKLKKLVKKAPIIPETLEALDVLNRLKQSQVHFGLVYDEYGHFEGIVTTADILEAIVGVFAHHQTSAEPDITEREDGSLLVSGSASIDNLSDRLKLAIPPTRQYQTVAGFVLDRLGHFPAVGEVFSALNHRFEIVDIDGRRIDKLIVSRSKPAPRRAMKK